VQNLTSSTAVSFAQVTSSEELTKHLILRPVNQKALLRVAGQYWVLYGLGLPTAKLNPSLVKWLWELATR